MPASLDQPVGEDRIEVPRRRPMIEHRRRRGRLVTEIDFHRMPLPGADLRTVGAKLKPLLRTLGDDCLERLERQRLAGTLHGVEQSGDVDPASLLQFYAD